MKKTTCTIAAAFVILFSANASADLDYAAQAMEKHEMEKPLSMPLLNVIDARASLNSVVIPTRYEELQARMEELSERKEK